MGKGDKLPDGSYILELDGAYALVMDRRHFLTGRLEDDKLTNPKAFCDREAALRDLRQRARVSKILDWQASRD